MEAWYLLQCKPRQEQRAVDNLELQQFEVFLPQVAVQRQNRGKRITQIEALFPGYLFVRFDPKFISAAVVRSTRGVSRFVQFGAQLCAVPDPIVCALMEHTADDSCPIQAVALPNKGDTVQITEGSFKGVNAIYQEPDGDKRSFLLIELIGKQTTISMENQAFTRDS